MFSEGPVFLRRAIRFSALFYYYVRIVNWKECKKSKLGVAFDLLYIFFKLKYYPDNYSACRLWEKDRDEWVYYYGSTYNSYPRKNLRREVQTYQHQIIFNDKSVTEILCRGINLPIPDSFGVILPRDDLHSFFKKIFTETSLKKLIVKPVLGHAGQGIVMAESTPDGIFVNDGSVRVRADSYRLKEKSIVQRVVTQSKEISKFSSSSLNTIRIVTLLTKSNEVMLLSASMRFGVGGAFIDNWSAGGIAVGIDHHCGRLMSVAFDKNGNQFHQHPVSGIRFEGFKIPLWDEVVDISIRVQQACSFYKLVGVDIALSDDGPILIEVNANPDIVFQEQTAGPFLKDQKILQEFSNYGLLINKYQKSLLNQYSSVRNNK